MTKRREKTQQDTFIVGLVRKPWLCAQKKRNSDERLNMREICKSMCLKFHFQKYFQCKGEGNEIGFLSTVVALHC